MLDPIETQILERLKADSKQPRKALAVDLNITEPSLSKRIKKMTEANIIQRFTIDVNFQRIGFGVAAMTLIKEKSQKQTEDLGNTISQIPYAVTIYRVAGEWDMNVIWKCRTNEDLNWCISQLLDHPGVDQIKTEILLSEVKNSSSGLLSVKDRYDPI